MPDLPVRRSGESVSPGEAYLGETPVLRTHAGTQPDVFLRWNAIPPTARAIDVVVHLHGFSQQGETMPLAEKVPRSGLDLTGRTRPTLAILPRGNWIRHTWYDFPALLDGGIDRLVDYAVKRFCDGRDLAVDRFILSGHSGGGMPAVDAIAGARRKPDELFVFDGLYGRDPSAGDPLQGIETIDTWLEDRFAQEPRRPGALRVVYIERQTGPFSRAVGARVAQRLAAARPGVEPILGQRYRVEASHVPHGYVAAVCGPQLLNDAGARFDWSRI
ncbi:MAG TPA: hypothetical protein VGS13_11840 [Stellaceae bacterium]|nr:hypothetical protein [Stellaceae bacterium]